MRSESENKSVAKSPLTFSSFSIHKLSSTRLKFVVLIEAETHLKEGEWKDLSY